MRIASIVTVRSEFIAFDEGWTGVRGHRLARVVLRHVSILLFLEVGAGFRIEGHSSACPLALLTSIAVLR